MSDPLILFPARIAIGYYVDPNGQSSAIMMTPEFYRALRDVLVRVGGAASPSQPIMLPDTFASIGLGADEASRDFTLNQSMAWDGPALAEVLLQAAQGQDFAPPDLLQSAGQDSTFSEVMQSTATDSLSETTYGSQF